MKKLIGSCPRSSGEPAHPGAEWDLRDWIDYEILLERDAARASSGTFEIETRDAAIRDRLTESFNAADLAELRRDTPENRRWWLGGWLRERRRQAFPSPPSPGEWFTASLSALRPLCLAAGATLAVLSLLSPFLLFAEERPIQVPLVLLFYIVPQLVLLALALLATARRSCRRGVSRAGPIENIFVATLRKYLAHLANNSSAEAGARPPSREALDAVFSRPRLRRTALRWPALHLLQWTGLAFAATICLTLLVSFPLLHFNLGWSTTFEGLQPEHVHRFAEITAKPWSFASGEGVGYPGLKEVRQTQTFRGKPLPADFPAQSAWATFLILSIFVYTFIPRLALLLWTGWQKRRATRLEAFDDRNSELLFYRLARPLMSATVEENKTETAPGQPRTHPFTPHETRPPLSGNPNSEDVWILTEMQLEPEETESLAEEVRRAIGLNPSTWLAIYTPEEQEQCLNQLRSVLAEPAGETESLHLVFLYRAADPIIQSFRQFFLRCLAAGGERIRPVFLLTSEDPAAPEAPDPDYVRLWENYAEENSGGPAIDVIVLSNSTHA